MHSSASIKSGTRKIKKEEKKKKKRERSHELNMTRQGRAGQGLGQQRI